MDGFLLGVQRARGLWVRFLSVSERTPNRGAILEGGLTRGAPIRPVYKTIHQVRRLSPIGSDTAGVCERSLGDLSRDEMLVIPDRSPDPTERGLSAY